jgi:hypothetical protein
LKKNIPESYTMSPLASAELLLYDEDQHLANENLNYFLYDTAESKY